MAEFLAAVKADRERPTEMASAERAAPNARRLSTMRSDLAKAGF
jgi:hypothetical protein